MTLPEAPENVPQAPENVPQSTAIPPSDWVTHPTVGEVITSLATGNSYTMGEKIGEGFFGMVYACVDTWDNNLAAKVMKPRAPYETVKAAAEAEFGKLLILRHPYITYVFDAFEYRDTFYIITERCHCPLTELPSNVGAHYKGALWIKAIARCLLQAVQYLHNSGFVHQDIHSGNVFAAFAKDEMVSDNPGAIHFKLGDLGVAKLFTEIDAANTRAQWMLPPEVLDASEFGPLDHRQDIYHCGLLFLQLLQGHELQFTPDEIKQGKPREMVLQLPAPYNFALEKALRRHVAFRTASAIEFWRDLNSPASSSDAVPAFPPPEPEPVQNPSP